MIVLNKHFDILGFSNSNAFLVDPKVVKGACGKSKIRFRRFPGSAPDFPEHTQYTVFVDLVHAKSGVEYQMSPRWLSWREMYHPLTLV
ncbi:hypothetical protein AVEN_259584-1 [Araneus ventricosus]|uniref:Uncharacterized protein n=1 Tax=Araneus ventricosus TaxID=182803 RepID=A0A4Y2ES38_ARAVE|nr:hypothetical protein AVEN_259584-1 [Araneus ventricosus]